MLTTAAAPVTGELTSGITSVQRSETTVDRLKLSGVVYPASQLPPPRVKVKASAAPEPAASCGILGRSTGASREAIRPTATPPRRWIITRPQASLHKRHSGEREAILNALCQSDDPKIAKRMNRLEQCMVCPLFCLRTDQTVGVALGMCRDRMCPTCAAARGRTVKARVLGCVGTMDSCRFLTLTLKHDDTKLSDKLDKLYASFRRMRQQKAWKKHVVGGIAVPEITLNTDTGQWHPHLHVLIDGDYFPHEIIKACWLEATGDSSIVDIRMVHSREAAAHYVSSYISKPAVVHKWAADSVCEYALAMHGRRLVMAFGSMHKAKGNDDDTGERPQLGGILCSTLRLDHALRGGCEYARLARRLLSACGGMCQRAAGDDVCAARTRGGPEQSNDQQRLVVALKRVSGDESAWLPEIEPLRRYNGQPNLGRKPTICGLRLWEDDGPA